MIKKVAFAVIALTFVSLLGLYLLDPNRRETVRILEPQNKLCSKDYMLSSLNVTSIAQDNRKLIWIGTSAGINVYNGKDYLQFFHDSHDSTALPDDYINTLYRDHKGRMWVGTQNGLARYEGGYRFKRIPLPANHENIVSIKENKQGIVVSTVKKTPQFDIPHISYILKKPQELISTTFKDAGGNLWVGFRNAGYQVISNNMMLYALANQNSLAEKTKNMDITCLQTVGQHILAGTTLRLFTFDNQNQHYDYTYYQDIFHDKHATPQGLINIVTVDDRNICLIGNHEMVCAQVAHGKLQLTSRTTPLPQLGAGTLSGKDVYASCQAPYIIRYRYGSKKTEFIPIQLPWYDEGTQLTTLSNGKILLFMKDMHIAILSPESKLCRELTLQGIEDTHNTDPAFARQDSHGNVWLGTKRSGLYRLNIAQGKVERMNFINDVHIQALLEDPRGQIWITTLKDAICYQPTTGAVLMNSLVSSSQNEWSRQYFDNAICLSPDGNIILGSSDGCIFLPPALGDKDLIANKQGTGKQQATYDNHTSLEKGLCIYHVDVKKQDGEKLTINNYDTFDNLGNGAQTKASRHYTFAHDENDLTFYFFYPNYSHRSSMRYQYILEGYNKQWNEPTYEHEANFANLSPGEYTFRLRLISSPHLPAIEERSIRITIQPALWASSAAWFFYIVAIILLLYYINSLYLRIRTNKLRLLQEQHEREREQRTNEMNMSFFANISHEFRNPITIIAGPLLSLKADKSLPQHVQTSLNHVCMSVNRMLRLIDQMLDFNQLEMDALRLKVSEMDITQALSDLLIGFEESTHVRHIQLTADIPHEPTNVWIDGDKFEKIMSNLLTNALKHTPENGLIRITAHTDKKEEKNKANYLKVSVYNSGSHIDEDKLQDVFKRYYQLAKTQSEHHYGWGTGIGLYYVKRLIGLHHGEIEVSNQEEGVEFSFILPIDKDIYKQGELTQEEAKVMQIPIDSSSIHTEQKTEKESQKESFGQEESHKPIKILVVDDDIDVAQYIRSIFAEDYCVENRYSAEEALADMEHINPDIILSDIIMGKMSGYDFCKTLKSNILFSHIPVILITAKSNMDEQIAGLRLGAVAYITKPFDPFYLRAAVEAQLTNMKTLRQRLGENTKTEALTEDVSNALSGQDRKFMDELYLLMEKRAAEMELNVGIIAHDLLISQSKFTYKLKELTGDTPGIFFRKYKLNKAAQLLREGKYNVSEIATMTGFGTAAHFSVAFKKQFGVSPSEY